MTDPGRALLASMRAGRAWVPWRCADDVVSQLEAQGCTVVRSCVAFVTWEACDFSPVSPATCEVRGK